VSGASTTHYSLGLVDPISRNVPGTINVLDQKHEPTVHTHTDLAEGVFSESPSYLDSASSRLFRRSEKHQRHAVPRGQGNQIAAGARPLELVRRLNQLL
jgi:hypothetical protein